MTRVLSLGLDGASWDMLDALLADGRLPNLQELVEEGARAPLRSVHPPVTCPAWRCSTSGKNPGKLGVYWWLTLDRETGDLATPDSRSFGTADVWDYLSDEGCRCAVVNVPMTYPPWPVDGVMVAGFGAPFRTNVTESITHPPTFQERLFEAYDWEVGVESIAESGGPERAYALIRSRFELLLDLLEEGYDYLHLTVFYVNMLQHEYGDGPETVRAWELIDDYLGELDDDLFTVVYSDHGHSTIEATFSVNRYLIDEGHLTVREHGRDAVTAGVYRLCKSTGISPRTVARAGRKVLPEAVYDKVRSATPTAMADLGKRIDWEQSRAVALSQGPVYVNRDAVADPGAFVDTLAAEFEALIGPDGGQVVDAAHRADEVYSGAHLDAAPDLVLVPADGWEIYGGVTPSMFETDVTSWTSGNHPLGTLLLHGDAVDSMQLGECSLLDIAPTVLRYLGCRVPTDLDGTAIVEPFADGLPDTGTRAPLPPPHDRSGSGDSDLETRLADLGYLE